MTWELGSDKNFGKLLEYECGLEGMFRDLPALSGICQYHGTHCPMMRSMWLYRKHRGVYLNETLSRVNPFYAPGAHRAVPRLSAPRLKEMIGDLHLQVESGA
jgi:hypothetical protein